MPLNRSELSDEDRDAKRRLPRYVTVSVAEGETFFNCDGAQTLDEARMQARKWIGSRQFTSTWGIMVLALEPVVLIRGHGPGKFSETDLEGE